MQPVVDDSGKLRIFYKRDLINIFDLVRSDQQILVQVLQVRSQLLLHELVVGGGVVVLDVQHVIRVHLRLRLLLDLEPLCDDIELHAATLDDVVLLV